MEVATIFTSQKKVIDLFDQFIYSWDALNLTSKDDDTAYFADRTDNKSEIYYHFKLNDVASELNYNYSEGDVARIQRHSENQTIFSFDLSFRRRETLEGLLKDFKAFIKTKVDIADILISDPFTGLKPL